MREAYTNCMRCNKTIYYGNATVGIHKNIEQMDKTEDYPDGIVTVIQSDELMVLCAECGNKLDQAKLEKYLKSGRAFRQ